MTPEQMNIAIAERCGWKNIRSSYRSWDGPDTIEWHGIEPTEECQTRLIFQQIPNYHADLNAMHEAEETLYEFGLYFENLERVCRTGSAMMFSSPGVWSVHATAAERAEAFLKTIGKWED